MAFTKFNDRVNGEILRMLKLNYPHKQIQKEMKKEGINISRVTISRIKNGKDVEPKLIPKEKNTGNRKDHYLVMTKEKIKKLEKMVKSKNPPTMKQMSQQLNISVPLIEYHIHKTLNMKSVKKAKSSCHQQS